MDSRSASRSNGNKLHQMTPASPERRVSGPLGSAAALKQIGTPDHSGHLKKKGDTIGWKTRFFVLKGAHLYYLKSEHVSHSIIYQDDIKKIADAGRRTESKATSTSKATESLWTVTPTPDLTVSDWLETTNHTTSPRLNRRSSGNG